MKPLRWYLVILTAVFGIIPMRAGLQDTLTILHLNDTHSNLTAHGPRSFDLKGTRAGIGRAATVAGMTRIAEPNVLFLHAGDLFVGDLAFNYTFGTAELQILQRFGLDAMAVGNHEFDLMPTTLLGSLEAAFGSDPHFPLLSANAILDSPSVASLKSHIRPHLIKDLQGVKVGIIGLTTPETNVLSLPSPVFIDTSIDVVLQRELTDLALAGTQVNILLSHMGLMYDRMIAASTPYLHVIVGGHDHDVLIEPEAVINPLGDTTWIVQAGAFYENMGKLRLTVSGSEVHLLDYQLIQLDETIPVVEEVDSLAQWVDEMIATTFPIDPRVSVGTLEFISSKIVDRLTPYYPASVVVPIQNNRDQLTELSVDLPIVHEAITPVAALVSMAFQLGGETELGLTVGGATAQPLNSGYVTGFDLFRMIGYGFNTDDGLGYRLATFRIKGSDLLLGLEWGLSSIEVNDEYFVQGFPLRYTYSASRPAFTRLDSVWVGNVMLDTGKVYTITTNEFVLAVLNDFVAPQLGITIMDPDVLEGSTELQSVVRFVTTGIEEEGAFQNIPMTCTLDQNYPNPFNPSTSIRYSLAVDARVRLTIYDVLGRELVVLASGERLAGTHSVEWYADRPSGVYFYRLEVIDVRSGERFSQTRKMVLQK